VDISPSNQKRTNASDPVTPDDGPTWACLEINPRSLHNRPYSPYALNNHLVYSSVPWKWRDKHGKAFDLNLHTAIHDELNRPKSGAKKNRQINLTVLGILLWKLMTFLYGCRFLKTRAEALVLCIFQVLANEYPELFKDILIKESRKFLRKHVTHAHKFQRTIDTQPTGGLNYGSIEGIRKGVEELSRCEVGIIPSYSTIARCARELEAYASESHGLTINERQTDHGPVYYFEFYNFIRLLLSGFGLLEHARTGSSSKPVMICWTLDGAQLSRLWVMLRAV
jgi:hypothetical protein